MNRKDTLMMLTNLLSMYPNHTLNDYATERWVEAMRDVPAQAAYTVVERWIDTEKWFPTVAEFKERMHDAASPLPSPDEAWELVLERVRSTYPGVPAPAWQTHLEIKEALNDIGKIWAVRTAEGDTLERKRAQFVRAYTRRRDAARGVSALAPGMKEIAS